MIPIDQWRNIFYFLFLSGFKRLPKPILELNNVSAINPQIHRITAVAAFPNAEAIIYLTEAIRSIIPIYVHRVVKIDRRGEVLQYLTPKEYNPHSNNTCRGLLVLGDMLYVIQKNSSVERLNLSQFETGLTVQKDVITQLHHIEDTKDVVNFAPLFHDPTLIPDKDLLLLADSTKHEIFTYRLSTKHKEVHVRGLKHARSVSYIFDNNKIFYLVCGGNEVRVYNSTWGLVSTIGKTGSWSEKLSMPTSAIMLPDGHVIISDFFERRVSEFSVDGRFLDILLTKPDFWPVYLTFSYPHLWVLDKENNLYRYKLFKN